MAGRCQPCSCLGRGRVRAGLGYAQRNFRWVGWAKVIIWGQKPGVGVLILGTVSSSSSSSQCPGSACPEVVHLLGRKTGGPASPLEWLFGGGKEAVRL